MSNTVCLTRHLGLDVLISDLSSTRRVDEAFGLVEGKVPGITGDELATCVRLVGLDASGAHQDVDAFVA